MNEYADYIKKGKKAELIIRQDGCTARFFATFCSMCDDYLIFTHPKSKHLEFKFPKGQNIELYVYTNGGIFKLDCKLLLSTPFECRLSKPFNVNRMQRREYIRVNMNIKTLIKLKSQSGTKKLEALSRNISAKGINFLLRENISDWTQIELTLLFAEGSITTLAQVVKSLPVETQKGKCYDTSLMFVTISDKEIDFIVKKCFEFEANQRRRLLDSQEELK